MILLIVNSIFVLLLCFQCLILFYDVRGKGRTHVVHAEKHKTLDGEKSCSKDEAETETPIPYASNEEKIIWCLFFYPIWNLYMLCFSILLLLPSSILMCWVISLLLSVKSLSIIHVPFLLCLYLPALPWLIPLEGLQNLPHFLRFFSGARVRLILFIFNRRISSKDF